MTSRELSDKQLSCAACGDGFVFSAGEQELRLLRGVSQQPELCPTCVRARLTQHSALSAQHYSKANSR